MRRSAVGVFSKPNGERGNHSLNGSGGEVKPYAAATPVKTSPEIVSTLGHGMLITGNIVCEGSLQIFGRLIGDIHASNLVICEGAQVEGKVIAQDTTIHGVFKGTIHGNNVNLQSTAVVDDEIYNKTLTILQNADFEGVSRRLDKPVDAPSSAQAKPLLSPSVADTVPADGSPAP
jgi:cytoskeletal protein CcmA (bactofilin family)